MSAETLGMLLRDPGATARRCVEDRGLRELVAVSLAAIGGGSALFGAALGAHRGGLQVLAAGAKLPLAVLATLAIAVPAFHALASAHGRSWSFRTTLALCLAAMARASLVLLALSPLLWVAVDHGLGYHASAVAGALLYGISGLAALGVLARGLGPGRGRVAATLAFVVVFFAVGGQTAWIFRPYLVRPTAVDVPLLRATEGSFADAVLTSSRSAAGFYPAPEWIEGTTRGRRGATRSAAPAGSERETGVTPAATGFEHEAAPAGNGWEQAPVSREDVDGAW